MGCGGGHPTTLAVTNTATVTVAATVTTTVTATATPTSVPPTAQPTTPTDTAVLLKPFVGSWYGHGRGLTIDASGHGVITYRIYRFCSADPTPPCDEYQGHEITGGGRIVFVLTTAYPAGSATVGQGTLISSTDPTVPTGPITARVQGYLLTGTFLPTAPFCGSGAPRGTCGA